MLPSPLSFLVKHRGRLLAAVAVALCTLGLVPQAADHPPQGARSGVILITVDTLRADRLSSYGYARQTSPSIDRLIENGVAFTQARTVEPLTNPALSSMIMSLYPHQHGGSRNGLRVRSALASLPKTLQAHGYRTAAFVGNWTLRHKISGLAEHFEDYEEVLTRKRYFGLVKGEANAEDITAAGLDWLAHHVRSYPGQPFLLWLHYTEPHAPYRLHKEYLERLGLAGQSNYPDADRYDTEIAFVDQRIGEFLDGVKRLSLSDDTLIAFTSDHGESLGEHNYWGHGRNLYEPGLRIPMSLYWPGRLQPRVIEAPALIIDLAPTILSLLGYEPPSVFQGYDWVDVFSGKAPPVDRVTRYQAHRGAVMSKHDSDTRRVAGLLSVGLIHRSRKEVFHVEKQRRWLFDLEADPLELHSVVNEQQSPTEGLTAWLDLVYAGLDEFDDTPPVPLDEESIEQLRSLGYVD